MTTTTDNVNKDDDVYLVLKWNDGWTLDYIGHASKKEASDYIERCTRILRVTRQDYMIAKIV
ncbi:hypothetical protein [Paenibacillus sp. QZ-Y1]|uniref:hypothetical protein n=1 Tax=Paenibacillus sp. QZ-Y1 TaxID=3414511 RepID=UPI003F7A5C3E